MDIMMVVLDFYKSLFMFIVRIVYAYVQYENDILKI